MFYSKLESPTGAVFHHSMNILCKYVLSKFPKIAVLNVSAATQTYLMYIYPDLCIMGTVRCLSARISAETWVR